MSGTATAPAPARPVSRIGSVVRLHFVNPVTVLATPSIVIAAIFVINVAVWWIVGTSVTSAADRADATEGFQWSGASWWIFVYVMVVAIQSMNSTFAYAQGMSVTRRTYYVGSSVAFVLLSALWTVVFTVLGLIESATGGWGLGGRMFTATYFTENPATRSLVVFVAFLFFSFVGAAIGTVFVRWRGIGVTLTLLGVGLLLAGLATLATVAGAWPAIGDGLSSAGPTGIALWSLVVTAVVGLAGYLNLRRATPRG